LKETTMLQHPTLDQLRQLKLTGMACAFAELRDNPEADELNHGQWLALLLDREETERNDRRLTYRLRNARLRHGEASIEDVDYRTPRRLDKSLFQQLARGKWISQKQNLIIGGPTGIGKSWLACALGQKACRDDFSVLYKRIPRMFAELDMGRADGRYPRLFRALIKPNLLILDDWGLDRLNADQRRDLMEIVEDRYQNASILITSQLPVSKWHEIIGDPTFADAILDRIIHNAHRIDLDGQSMRKTRTDKTGQTNIDQTEEK
jgi:DNA replication protein DnaC